MRIKEAQALVKRGEPGAGVNVAVLDSGVSRQGGQIPVVGGTSITGRTEIDDPHGTAVASLVAGAIPARRQAARRGSGGRHPRRARLRHLG